MSPPVERRVKQGIVRPWFGKTKSEHPREGLHIGGAISRGMVRALRQIGAAVRAVKNGVSHRFGSYMGVWRRNARTKLVRPCSRFQFSKADENIFRILGDRICAILIYFTNCGADLAFTE
jgi:hypothetical protein